MGASRAASQSSAAAIAEPTSASRPSRVRPAQAPAAGDRRGPRPARRVVPISLPLSLSDRDSAQRLRSVVSSHDPGEPLSRVDQQSLRALTPAPLDDIRLHRGPGSRLSADLLNAEALTIGHDIVLGRAADSGPESRRQWLLAHEVAHVLQQQPAPSAPAAAASAATTAAPEVQADRFADAAMATRAGAAVETPALGRMPLEIARKVIWKSIVDLPGDMMLILDVDDGDFVGGCVKQIAPHVGAKLIKKSPHTQLFNIHVGFITNAAGEFCIFFYESVTGICEMKCFPSKEALKEAWEEIKAWLKELIIKVLKALAIAILVVVVVYLAMLIVEAIMGALLVLA